MVNLLNKLFDKQFLELEQMPLIAEYTFWENLKDRRIIINENIDDHIVETAIMQIIKFNREDANIPQCKRKPIEIYINSCGGAVDIGLALVNVIETSETPVHTITLGRAFSMGALIAIAGHKRYCYKYSSYLIHDGSMVAANSSAKAKDQMEFYDKIDNQIKRFVLERTKIDDKFYEDNYRKELYLTADESFNLGLVDEIIGMYEKFKPEVTD